MRKLASVQRVISVSPIEGADRIVQIQVLGWRLVAQIGEFRSGDYCVYFEIDSILPDRPEFEFMRQRKFRVRTMKMRGAISQGLAMPLSTFSELDGMRLHGGDDLTDRLGVKKYEPPVSASLGGLALGAFPTHVVPKTDEMRIQSIPKILDEIRELDVYATVKMDGSSVTYYVTHGEEGVRFGVCSRNLELKENTTNTFWQLARKLDIEEKLTTEAGRGRTLAIQGEVCGPGVNKNRQKLESLELFVFNVYDVDRQLYLDFEEAQQVIEDLGLTSVPVMDDTLKSGDRPETIDGWIELANVLMPWGPAEGIVVRPTEERWSEAVQGRLSFKVVNNQWLLKFKE